MKIIFSPKRKIIISLLLGLLSALLTWITLSREEKRIRTHFTMTTVLQGKKYITEGKPVTADLVEEVSLPVAYLQPTALQKRTELYDKEGNPLFNARIGILKGEQISKSKLDEATVFRGLAWTLPVGQTALSLNLSAEQAVAGLLQPGDWVNIYCTIDKQPDWPKDQTKLILPQVRVVAIQDQIWDPSEPLRGYVRPKDMALDRILVTFALHPYEAGLMTLAADKGRIVLALVSPLESKTRSVPGVELVNLR